jgi:hypothetical protein
VQQGDRKTTTLCLHSTTRRENEQDIEDDDDGEEEKKGATRPENLITHHTHHTKLGIPIGIKKLFL